MSNFLSHHHELRIPAMETLSDLTKLLFHGKEEKAHHESDHGEESHTDHLTDHKVEHHHEHHHEHHKKSLATAKRHAHAGPKRGVIAVYGINDDEAAQQRSNRIGIRVDRIRSIYIREMRNAEEKHTHSAAQHHIHQTEQPDDSSLEEIYQSMFAENDSIEIENPLPQNDHSSTTIDDLFVTPQEPQPVPVKRGRFSVSKLRVRFVETSTENEPDTEQVSSGSNTTTSEQIETAVPTNSDQGDTSLSPKSATIRYAYLQEHTEEHPHAVSHLHHSHHSAEIHKSRKKQGRFSGENLRNNYLDSQE